MLCSVGSIHYPVMLKGWGGGCQHICRLGTTNNSESSK